MVSPFRQASPYIHLGLLVLLFLFCSNIVSSHATSESAHGESSSTAAPHQQDLAHETKGDSAHEPDHENEAEHQEGTLAHHTSASESASGESAEPVELVDSVKDFPATLTNGLSSDLNHDGAKIQAIVDVADSSMAHQGVEAGLSNGIPAEPAEDSAGKLQKHSSSSGAASKQSHLEVVIDDDDKDTAHEASSSSSSSSSLAAKTTTDAPAQAGKMQRSSSESTKESGLQPGAVATDEEKKRANELGETWVLPSVQPPGQLLPTPYPYPYPYAYNPLVYPRPLPRSRRLKGGYPALPSVYSYPYPRPVVTTTLSVPYIPYQPEAYRAKEAARDWKVDPQYQKQGKVAVAPSVPVFSAAGTCLNCQFDPSTASASPMIVPFATSMAPVTVLPNGVALQLQHKSTEEEKSSA